MCAMTMGSTYELYNKSQLLAILRARDEEVVDLQKATEALVQQIETMRVLFKRLTKEHEENMERQREELTSRFETERKQLLATIAEAKSSAAASAATRANDAKKLSLLQDRMASQTLVNSTLVNVSSESAAGAGGISSDLKARFAALEAALHNERMGRAADQTALVAAESERSQLRKLLHDTESRSKTFEAALKERDDEINLLMTKTVKRRGAGELPTYNAAEGEIALQTVTTAAAPAEEEVLTPPFLPHHFLFLGLHVSEQEEITAAATAATKRVNGATNSQHREEVRSAHVHIKGGGAGEEKEMSTDASPPLFLVIKDTIAPAATDARVKPGDVLIAATVRKTYTFNADVYRTVGTERRRLLSAGGERVENEGAGDTTANRFATATGGAAVGGRRRSSSAAVRLDDEQRVEGIGREREKEDDDYYEGYPKGIGMSLDRAASASALTRASPSPPPPHPHPRGRGLLAQRSSSSQVAAAQRKPKHQQQPDVVVDLPTTGCKKSKDVSNPRSASARSESRDTPTEIQPISLTPQLHHPSPLTVYEQLINELSLYAQVELTVGRRHTTTTTTTVPAEYGDEHLREASPPSVERLLVTTLDPFYPMVAEF